MVNLGSGESSEKKDSAPSHGDMLKSSQLHTSSELLVKFRIRQPRSCPDNLRGSRESCERILVHGMLFAQRG
jgi:hypothetical protein